MIVINLDKAKNIANDIRRAARAEEFKPLDVKATIPAEAAEAEAARQAVRDKYAAMQDQIDTAQTAEELLAVMPKVAHHARATTKGAHDATTN